MNVIDGSFGEGGGQILRTALGLSLLTQRPFRMEKIRANRPKPGLRIQHLMCVRAAQEIGAAEVSGGAIGSREISFVPHDVRSGNYSFVLDTAGSTTLIFQTVLPALMLADGPSELTLEGGTHNSMAPPYDFLAEAFLPLLERMGPRVTMELVRPGFYPRGGGELRVTIEPCKSLKPLEITEAGKLQQRQARIYLAGLPMHIAEREQLTLQKALGWDPKLFDIRFYGNDCGPGNAICILLNYNPVTEVFTAFGQQGVSAEKVAKAVVRQIKGYQRAEVPVGEHLADQLLIPLALAGGGRYRIAKPTKHTLTNIEVINRFLGVKIDVGQLTENRYEIVVCS